MALGLPALLFAWTMYGGAGGRVAIGDAVKFQFIGRALAVPHEPGYPQYVLLSYVWSLLPLPTTLAFKINVLSGVFALIAGTFVYLSAVRLAGSVWAAVLATWFLLLSADVWLLATQAEVYTLNLAWVAIVTWAGLRWRATRSDRWLVAMMFAYALSFGNHLLMVTMLPALLALVLATDRSVLTSPRMMAAGAAAVGTGLAQYLFLWWRSYYPVPGMLPRFPPNASFLDILRWSAGAHFTEKHFLSSGISGWPSRMIETWGYGFLVLTPTLVAVAAYGLRLLWRRDRGSTLFLVAVALGVTAFASAYEIRSWPYYCFPAWLALVLAFAVGASDIFGRGRRWQIGFSSALAISLLYVAVGTYGELVAADPPYDSAAAVEVAPSNAIIVPSLATRTAGNLGHYYATVYGQDHVREMTFVGARDLLQDPDLLLGRRHVYAQSAVEAEWLWSRGVEGLLTLVSPGSSDSGFTSRTPQPIERVFYGLRGNVVSLVIRRTGERVPHEPSLFITVLAPGLTHARATLRWPLDSNSDWAEQFRIALRRARQHETLLVLGLQMTPAQRSEVSLALTRLLDQAPDLDTVGDDFVLAFRRGMRERLPLLQTLTHEGVEVALPLAPSR
ncbi:MAG: DUF2723 domain-containing protein [Acidobacteria bacterium]|nr:DUF2723 domain-containing protein [Acidobacteriota bacterium]